MLKLKAILEDLPGQPRGIFVTKTGYQSGAMDVAKANGIITYELREPTDADWKGRIKTIILNFKAYMPDTRVKVISDDVWIQAELKRLDLREINLTIAGMEDEIFIKNEDGSVWKSINDIKTEEQEKVGMTEVYNKEVTIPMDCDRYIDTGNSQFPRVKIKKIQALVTNGLYEHTTEIDATKMVGYILKNLIDNSEIVLDKDGKIRKDNV